MILGRVLIGIDLHVARSVARVCADNTIGGRCLTLGKQQVHMMSGNLSEILSEVGRAQKNGDTFTLDPKVARDLDTLKDRDTYFSHLQHYRDLGGISDVALFTALGFGEVRSLDLGGLDGEDYIYDLNQTPVLEVIEEPFDFVFDGGTIEHVFHLPNVLRNIFDMLADGGVVYHFLPANNYVDHGFYQFSPGLFHQYYQENHYDILCLQLAETSREFPGADPATFTDYAELEDLENSDLKTARTFGYSVVVAARKTARSTWDVIPQQKLYRDRWQEGSNPALVKATD